MKKFLVTLLAVAGLFTTFAPMGHAAAEYSIQANYIEIEPTFMIFNDRINHIVTNSGTANAQAFGWTPLFRDDVRFRVTVGGFIGLQSINIGVTVRNPAGHVVNVPGSYRVGLAQNGTWYFNVPAALRGTSPAMHTIEFRVSTNTPVGNVSPSAMVRIDALNW